MGWAVAGEAVETTERELPGENVAKRNANANATLLVDATAAPNPYYCPPSPFEESVKRIAQSYKDSDKELQDLLARQRSGDLDKGFTSYIAPNAEQKRLSYLQSLPLSDWLAGKGKANGGLAYQVTGWDALSFRGPHEHMSRLEMIESIDQQMAEAKSAGKSEEFRALCEQKHKVNAQTSTAEMDNQKAAMAALVMALPIPGGAARMPRPGAGRGIFLKRSQPTPVEPPRTPRSGPNAAPTVGEPVSVSNGEYLETWRDFLVPGTFSFNGARYMGLKLGLPTRYVSPLGSCQISMFDEVFSNPERGKLIFHNADGKRIWFDRPFNFLPSTNAGFPNLELKAPWLKQLTVKDGPVTRHFRQYDDGIYRLEKIDDLNGFELVLIRGEDGRLERVDGPDGLSLTFENDDVGHRTRITLVGTDGSKLELARYAYDAKGRMTRADCTFAMSARYGWQADHDLLDSWHNVTRDSVTRFTYDDAGRVVHTATNGIWNGDRFLYQEGETTYLPGGGQTGAQRFRYDENENVTAEIDALGGTVVHRYDQNGFRISTTDQNGNSHRTRYDIRGNVQEASDPEGRTTTYIWGDDGELHLVIDGAGNRKTYEHDARSNVISETDAEGNVIRLGRDEKGRVVTTHFANGAVERRAWDDFNRLSSMTDARGATTTFEYDVFNRLLATTDALGQTTRQEYHSGTGGFDKPSRLTRPDGVSASQGFDGQGLLAFATDGEGRTWTYKNAAFGILESITDPKGGLISFSYDVEGRILSITNALGLTYHYGRDAAGRVVEEEDFDGRLTQYRRDAVGRVVETIKPDGARLVYGYDKAGLIRRIETFDAKGAPDDLTRFWYDGRGLLVKAENHAALVEFERDRNGRIVSETLNGKRIKSKRDSMGDRVAREMMGFGGGTVEFVRDPLGAVEQMIAGETQITFQRDLLGREIGRETGGFGLSQRYDVTGQLAAQVAGPKSPADIGISRLGWSVPSGEGQPKRQGTIARIYQYDRAFAPMRIDDGLWGEVRFEYDDNGQVISAEGTRGAERFDYDPARNLAGASSSAPFSTQSAGYGASFDAAFGSVTPSSRPSAWHRTPGGVVQIARGPSNERMQLTHDDCGRLIERRVERNGFRAERWRYRWDSYDRMTAVTKDDGEEWFFRYDPFGRRISKVKRFSGEEKERVARLWPALVGSDGVPASAIGAGQDSQAENDNALPVVGTTYLWDGDRMIAEAPLQLNGNVAWEAAVHWHFEEDTHRLLAKQLASGEILAVVCDHLGTPKEMFDKRGDLVWAVDHHVWGAIRTVRIQDTLATTPKYKLPADEMHCPWRFPGQYEDAETGLYYNRFRYYDPLTGQYVSPDPVGLTGGDRPQSYVANPLIETDYLGLQARGPDGKFLPANGLPGPGSTFATSVTQAYRDRGYQVFENVTVRINGKLVSYADQVAVKGRQILIIESKSGRVTLSEGQRTVQNAIQTGQPITLTGKNAPNIPGTITPNNPIVLPQGSYVRETPR